MKAARCPVNPVSKCEEDAGIREVKNNKGSEQDEMRRHRFHVMGSGLHQWRTVGANPQA